MVHTCKVLDKKIVLHTYATRSYLTYNIIFQRLKVEQTLFGQTVGFRMRTFRFKTAETASEDQNQTITCKLHLEPTEDIVEEQAPNCSCYTVDDCLGKSFILNFT